MDPSQTLPEFIATTSEKGKALSARISDAEQQDDTTRNEATFELQALCVDVFTTFEARMQHHFKRGPFSRKLKQLLIQSEKAEIADRIHHYYLAVNVLKHGKGASYRELLQTDSEIVKMRAAEVNGDEQNALGLVDVTVPLFVDGLCATLLDAHNFLENK